MMMMRRPQSICISTHLENPRHHTTGQRATDEAVRPISLSSVSLSSCLRRFSGGRSSRCFRFQRKRVNTWDIVFRRRQRQGIDSVVVVQVVVNSLSGRNIRCIDMGFRYSYYYMSVTGSCLSICWSSVGDNLNATVIMMMEYR